MTFGERLKYLREEAELRQQDIAKQLNISPRMISYYETNQHFPSDAQMIIDLANFFNVSIDYLFGVINIKNSAALNDFNSEFIALSEENKKSVMNYIKFLKSMQ